MWPKPLKVIRPCNLFHTMNRPLTCNDPFYVCKTWPYDHETLSFKNNTTIVHTFKTRQNNSKTSIKTTCNKCILQDLTITLFLILKLYLYYVIRKLPMWLAECIEVMCLSLHWIGYTITTMDTESWLNNQNQVYEVVLW